MYSPVSRPANTAWPSPPGQLRDGHGLRLFTAGRLSLDFLGTVGHRPAQHVERLTDREALRRWLLEAGLPAARSAPTDDDLAEARAVPEALYRIIDSRVDGEPASDPIPATPPTPDEVALLNQVAATPPPPARVRLEPAGEVSVGWARPDGIRPLLSLMSAMRWT